MDKVDNNALSLPRNAQELSLGERSCQEQIIHMGSIDLRLLSFADFDQEVLTAIENNEDYCPLYGQVWPAALALCEYLQDLSLKESFAGKKALELGCGLALPSLLAAKLQLEVTATDHHPEVASFVNFHRDLNGIPQEKLRFFSLDFCQNAKNNEISAQDWDFILASDILYEPTLFPSILSRLEQVAGAKTRIILSDPGRVGLGHFLSMLESRGFHIRHQNCKTNDCQVLVFRKQQ